MVSLVDLVRDRRGDMMILKLLKDSTKVDQVVFNHNDVRQAVRDVLGDRPLDVMYIDDDSQALIFANGSEERALPLNLYASALCCFRTEIRGPAVLVAVDYDGQFKEFNKFPL